MNVLVSGVNGLRQIDTEQEGVLREMPLDESNALCAGDDAVYAASDAERVIYMLNAKTLLPQSVFAGGPGLSQLCLSPDGERLYALFAGADSVMMFCAATGAPLVLARVGVNPQHMYLNASGELLAVAGGNDGTLHLLCGRTLKALMRFSGEGICTHACVGENTAYALRLTEALNAQFDAYQGNSRRHTLLFPQSPGGMILHRSSLIVAAGMRLYRINARRMNVMSAGSAPEHIGKLLLIRGRLLAIDPLSETLRILLPDGGSWRTLLEGARDAAHSLPPSRAYSS